jgi:hypothetical protein
MLRSWLRHLPFKNRRQLIFKMTGDPLPLSTDITHDNVLYHVHYYEIIEDKTRMAREYSRSP